METWKNIKHLKGFYQVSNMGRIRSLTRKIFAPTPWGDMGFRKYKGRLLKLNSGNRYVTIALSKNSIRNTYNVHRLVLESFVGRCPKNFECCHWDNNKHNNKLSNLRWGTKKDNMADKKRHGTNTPVWGVNTVSAKLNDKKVKQIRILHKAGIGSRQLAKKFNVSKTTICSAISGKHWGHVKWC